MLQLRILIFLILLVIIDLYFYQAVKKVTDRLSPGKRKLVKFIYFTFTAAAFCFVLSALVTDFGKWPKPLKTYFTSIFFVVSISKFTGLLFIMGEDIIRGIRISIRIIRNKFFSNKKTPSTAEPEPSAVITGNAIPRSAFISQLAIASAAVPFSTLIFGMVKGAFDFKVFNIPLLIPGLPASFAGVKIIQLSDIHAGSFYSSEPFKKAVEMVMSQDPDYVFFTGDLVNDRSEEVLPHIDVLKQIQAPGGVFSVLGNHDYGDYVKWPSEDLKQENMEVMYKVHEALGWDLMLNESRVLTRGTDSIGLIGVENWSGSPRFPKYGDLDVARRAVADIPVKLLLSHDPTHWDSQVRPSHPDIAVTFSGHTHGMQFGVEIPGFRWSPSQYIFEQWAGLYSDGFQQLYVNRGLGFLGYSGRVGIKPEITVFELQPA